jgi:hypothetical protein
VKTTQAPVYVVNDTAFGNDTDTNLNTIWCGEITSQESKGINVTNNIAGATSATGCGANPNYAIYVADGDLHRCGGDQILLSGLQGRMRVRAPVQGFLTQQAIFSVLILYLLTHRQRTLDCQIVQVRQAWLNAWHLPLRDYSPKRPRL